MAVWLQIKVPWLWATVHVLTPALSVTQQRRCSCSCRLWRCMSVMPLPSPLHNSDELVVNCVAVMGQSFIVYLLQCLLLGRIRREIAGLLQQQGITASIYAAFLDWKRFFGKKFVLGDPVYQKKLKRWINLSFFQRPMIN